MERKPGLLSFGSDAVALGILVFATAAMYGDSLGKPLWLDELLSWATDTLPSAPQIWRTQSTAPLSLDPPLFHWATHFVVQAFGDSDLSMRLVSMAAMLVCLWFVYLFEKRSGDRVAGLLAMSILVASGAFAYGYECRPYALVLAMASASLWFWLNIARGVARKESLAGLALCLAAADSSHYYSVLICVPFLAGELIRGLRRRVIDWPVLAAIVAGNSVMLVFIPLVRASKAYQVNYWRGISALDLSETYRQLFDSSLAGFIPLLAALAFAYGRRPKQALESEPDVPTQLEETTVLAIFAIYPLFTWVFSLIVTHTYVERLSLPVILGLSILLSRAFRKLAQSSALLIVSSGIILVPVAHHALTSARAGLGPQIAAISNEASVFSSIPGGKIVMTEAPFYLAAMRYAPPSIRTRLNLMDPYASAIAEGRKSTLDMMVLGVRLGTSFPVLTTDELRRLPEPFFLVCKCSGPDVQRVFYGDMVVNPGSYAGQSVFEIGKQ